MGEWTFISGVLIMRGRGDNVWCIYHAGEWTFMCGVFIIQGSGRLCLMYLSLGGVEV